MAACDDLVTPRTLGPLHDAAAGTDGPLARALAGDGADDRVFTALMEELAAQRPTVLLIEDAHWADDAPSTCSATPRAGSGRSARCSS